MTLVYSTGTCTGCEKEGVRIVKKLPNGKYCHPCNQKRLNQRESVKEDAKEKPTLLIWMKKVFEASPKKCEECGIELEFAPIHVSHILSRGSYKVYAEDDRNFNILCAEHHQTWEFGDRRSMKIYERTKETSLMLIREYYGADLIKP